ncbi:vacuolar ATP synthase subunit g, putative [Babesia microti strain RI]|uniref:Vacuolar ATP synthase subunit g, putative n=1 Tax=Babesia microti (strain RI) TaxID=1133968 RepID=A0A1N6LXF2_BABMR|nr:vacuolar ATP synthase subunit g, putative [Babesia microti strain RI]SIO73541.1 vacuolar ATP synthase subunit g, putative [Babesia microti strain RI]|eukprot:XP_021337632.1 vacuolar ATP synthase subunit g, putative [Babesia microti strain RI]
MSNNSSNALIQQLLKAEQEAEEIIKRAKDAKAKLLNDAEIMAQKEIEQFKKMEDELFKEKLKELPNENDTTINKMREETEQIIKKYRQKAASISESLVNFLVTNVITVNLPTNTLES